MAHFKTLYTSFICLQTLSSFANNLQSTDTINAKVLNEIVVEAERQYITNDKTTFIPTQQEKKTSTGGTELLQRMALPSVFVSPTDNSILTPSGESFSTFIDFLPATPSDLSNLRTMDIARVEVYNYPKDPRFGGARYVINIRMKKYEYGGYTTIRGQQVFIDNRGNYNIATKFAYKKMTYDLAGGYGYNRSTHVGEHSTTDYVFPANNVKRIETTDNGLLKSQSLFASFRAIYKNDKSIVSNTIGIQSLKQPDCSEINSTSFSVEAYPSGQTQTFSNNSNYSPSWSGDYQFYLPRNLTLIFSPSASIGKYSQDYKFLSGDKNIINNVDEDVWGIGATATIQKQLNAHSVSFSMSWGGQGNNLEYTGTSPANVSTKYHYGGGRVSANLQFEKWWVQGNVGLFLNRTSINSQTKNEISPKYFIATGYSFSRKHSLSLSSEMSYWTIPLSQQGDNMQVLNDIDVLYGNPNLDTYLYNSVRLRYQWLPMNKFSLSLYSGFYRLTNPISYTFTPDETMLPTIMVRSYTNSGFLNNFNYGGAVTLRLLGNSLAFRVGLSGEIATTHGEQQSYRCNYLKGNGLVQYAKGSFWAQLVYESKAKNISTTTKSEFPQYYSLALGWGNGNLNISAKVSNLFNSGWNCGKTVIYAENYNCVSQTFSSRYHRAFEINLSYSFSYGKKVKRTDTPNAASAISSAILK